MTNMNVHSADGAPCSHMRSLLDRAADGREKSLVVRYARAHALRCRGCGRYLNSLKEMLFRLRGERSPEDAEALRRLSTKLNG